METEVFIIFFKIIFLARIYTERPFLVICDGHKTHVSLRLIEIARKENVTILILPPHSSYILQPLDLCVMKSLKTLAENCIGQKFPKKEFVKLLSTLWRELDPNIIQSGFRKGGIYPFNRDIIPEERSDKQRLQLWNQINRPHLQAGSSNEGRLCKLGQVLRDQWFMNQKLCKLDQVMKDQRFVQKQCRNAIQIHLSK
ncbi:hypothetical protein PR048_016882 [Dryococelus australis]|uniref:DDE-1 domain-containing protein n=1 Tax=Dryococelus australis TaxID=614101 RepID=A0ABQ9H7X6_9NEOP|nr:hypothetical protein PR048_016882 [Dryococelus australis]